MVILKTIVGNLSANVNEITFTDAIINSNSIIEVYYNSNDVYTVETWQRENTIGIVTSDHDFPVSVKVLINNVVAFEPYDDTEVLSQLSDLDNRVYHAEDAISGLTDRVGSAENDIDALETSMSGKQDALTAGDNITIENNVISASGGGAIIDYNNEIFTQSYSPTSSSYDYYYTATQDCYALFTNVCGTNNSCSAQIFDPNNVVLTTVQDIYSGSSIIQMMFCVYIPKDYKIKVHSSFSGAQLVFSAFGLL